MEHHQNWFVAVKPVESMSQDMKTDLNAFDVGILEEDCFLHCHFFIPEEVYSHAETVFRENGFDLTDRHPAICPHGELPGYEIFEKRVPLIEVREAQALARLAEQGVCMSGGAGKPHCHLKIPERNRERVMQILDDYGYYPA